NRFTNSGILLQTNGFTSIVSNFIGTDLTGNTALGNGDGIFISNSSGNVIGGVGTAGNVISGNTRYGVEIFNGSNGNQVIGNAIGTDASGTKALGNKFSGVGISNGSSNNIVGGTAAGARNIISANGSGSVGDGVSIFASAASNQVLGNLIGTDVTGTAALGNVAS